MKIFVSGGRVLPLIGGTPLATYPSTNGLSLSDTVVSGGVTLTLDRAVWQGVDALGTPFVIVPDGGLTVTSRTPGPYTIDYGGSPYAVNGTELNPRNLGDADPILNQKQGFDQRMGVSGWDGALDQAFPISVTAGDVLICAISAPEASFTPGGAADRAGHINRYAPFYFVGSPWPVGAFAPASIGWTGRSGLSPYTVNVDQYLTALPSLDLAGLGLPDVSDIIDRFCRHEVYGRIRSDSDSVGYEIRITRNAGFTSNYSRNYAGVVETAIFHLLGNQATIEQKRTLLKWAIRHGIDTLDPFVASNNYMAGAGGHWQHHWFTTALAAHATGQSLGLLKQYVPGAQLSQIFRYDAAILAGLSAPHDDLNLPFVSRRRTVTAVSGTEITMSTNRVGETGDPFWMNTPQMEIVRESDGASAMLVTPIDNTLGGANSNLIVWGIDAQPSPAFSPGDVVWFRYPLSLELEQSDWCSDVNRQTKAIRVNVVNPSHDASYRGTIRCTGQLLGLRAIGVWHADFDTVEEYILKQASRTFPSAEFPYPTPHNTYDWFEPFWSAHSATLLNGAP